jgi:hypothetical protein
MFFNVMKYTKLNRWFITKRIIYLAIRETKTISDQLYLATNLANLANSSLKQEYHQASLHFYTLR